ncbi:hypothetical protein [Bradyrhizobium sp. 2S1]|uniref:hypothetical protein n=1 Tax=Bradyrhizobium sp. 2S1 TaxID=1404429 RepID=UPI00140E9580|nr:hypothetical protein [Bradyrhizobium sp. 2S1]MCK7669163.1 hypothetical protein [Bradyrhizobium sp. 2S1]
MTNKPITRKGIFYWPTFEAARDFATARSLPTGRIIGYGLGWAIQLHVSGPYVGPATLNPNRHPAPFAKTDRGFARRVERQSKQIVRSACFA